MKNKLFLFLFGNGNLCDDDGDGDCCDDDNDDNVDDDDDDDATAALDNGGS